MTDHIVVFEGNERLIGRTVPVRIEEATAFTLFGTVVTGEQVGVADASHRFPRCCSRNQKTEESAGIAAGLSLGCIETSGNEGWHGDRCQKATFASGGLFRTTWPNRPSLRCSI